MSNTNYHRLTNGTVYSYSTCIRQEVSGLSIGNITKYSMTTSRHQAQAQCVSCDVLLDDVPQDTPELLTLAIQRNLFPDDAQDNDPTGETTRAISSVYRKCNKCFAEYVPDIGYNHAKS